MQLTREQISSVDGQNMWELIAEFPNQWDEAMKITEGLDLSIDADRINKICCAGMGGSAMGPDLIKAYSYNCCPHPVEVVSHYNIPDWVDEQTLFIACSFSGDTEETLSALKQARERNAMTIAITSGGALLLKATKEEFDYVKIPGGIPPRAALGFSFVPLFRIFDYLGFLDEGEDALSETELYLSQQGELLSDISDNEALSLARELQDTLPVVYSDSTIMKPVNQRWRNQFEENSKTLSYGNVLPEMTHNEIVGWEQVVHLTGRLSVIMLFDREDDKRVRKRMRIVKDLIEDQVSSIHVLSTRGESRLTRMFSLIQMADWTSFYLAIINNVDPTPIAKIDLLKSRLAEG
ncbi:MAG: bifunctional phosphoglucose/phosphomannose isomerase [Balneolaceae bacterium]|nr:bifunctional phosphoglucose/phosphomannose isomerase [Balneolaceae bacterium]